MKKIISVLLVLLALSLSACGGYNGNAQQETTPKATATSETIPVKTSATGPEATSSSSSSFTNKYGTSTTKCAHSGCNNYIASSGDTNCCTVHSNKCLECGKYIDGDAMYCMSCITNAANKAASSSSKSTSGSGSYSSGSSKKVTGTGKGGYDMPNENDKSFSDYVKRVDPDLYDELFG